ncbi:UNVERIFIED_CONTAM: hypothetical protein Sindi_0068200, partial [Sesamum indicum]
LGGSCRKLIGLWQPDFFIAKNLLFLIVAVSYDQPCSTLFPGICEIVVTLITPR